MIDDNLITVKNKIIEKGIKINPPLNRKIIDEFERCNNIILPKELAHFYTEVCNGCEMIDGFNLRKFEELDLHIDIMKKEFIFDKYWIWEDEPNDDLEPTVKHGNVELINIGCGQTWNIIITGKEKGQMWYFTDVGIQPCAPKRGFLSWFEFWLDGNEDYFMDFVYE